MNPYTNPYSPPTEGATPPPAGYGLSNQPTDRAEITNIAVEAMRQTKPWVTLIGVFALIGSGLMMLAGLLMIVMSLVLPRSGPMPAAVLGIVYIPMAALYVYPGLTLWKYGKSIGQLVMSRSASDLEAALEHQKSFWKFSGILTLIMVVLYFLVIVGAVISGVVAGASHH